MPPERSFGAVGSRAGAPAADLRVTTVVAPEGTTTHATGGPRLAPADTLNPRDLRESAGDLEDALLPVFAVRAQGEAQRAQVFAKREEHTVYLSRPDPALPADHPRNRMVVSTKGCLTDDQIDACLSLLASYI